MLSCLKLEWPLSSLKMLLGVSYTDEEAEVQRGHVTCPASWAEGSGWQRAADPGLGGLHGQCPSCHTLAASRINLKEAHFLSNGSCTGSRAGRNICFLIPALSPELHGINPSPGHVADGSSARGVETVVIQVQWTSRLLVPWGSDSTSLCSQLPKSKAFSYTSGSSC